MLRCPSMPRIARSPFLARPHGVSTNRATSVTINVRGLAEVEATSSSPSAPNVCASRNGVTHHHNERSSTREGRHSNRDNTPVCNYPANGALTVTRAVAASTAAAHNSRPVRRVRRPGRPSTTMCSGSPHPMTYRPCPVLDGRGPVRLAPMTRCPAVRSSRRPSSGRVDPTSRRPRTAATDRAPP